jgi:mono/diheme cytochrome c family protein
MSRSFRSPYLTRIAVCTGVALFAVGSMIFGPQESSARPASDQEFGQVPGQQDMPVVDPFGQIPGDDGEMPRRPRAKTTKKKKAADKSAAKKGDPTSKTKKGAATTDDADAKAGDTTQLKFSQDIAPILVANCAGCHSGDRPGVKRGKLELTTFEKLMKGSASHKIVVAGKPEESSLVLRIKGEETPRMPQGANRVLADSVIAKIEQWVKDGALLDAGIDGKAPMESYAASPDQLRKNELAKMPASERDKKIETVGLERFKQANPKLKPEIVSGEHFVVFSNLPHERATSTSKALETQYGHLKRLLGSPAMDWVEKVSLYVFASRNDLIEFNRTVESRETEPDTFSTAKLSIPQPYLAVVDPAGGRKDAPPAPKRGRSRSKKGEDRGSDGATDRSLIGLSTETLGTAAVLAAGNAPRWLAVGIGTYLSAAVEPRSMYYQQLRRTALANFNQGWATKVNEALGGSDQMTADSQHAVGFALVEAMMKTAETRPHFPAFVNGMLQGGEKLDEMLQKVFGGTREEFIEDTGTWVASQYGKLE